MNKLLVVLLIFVLSMSLRLWNLNEMGRTWDEQEYVEPGYRMVESMLRNDFNNSVFYTTYNHPPLVKYLYGVAAHFDVAKRLSNGEVFFNYDLTYSRVLSSILFSLGVIIVVLIGWKLWSPVVGVLSGIILSMLPFSLGVSQLVTTESLKIFIYPLTIYTYIILLEKFSWKRTLIAGIVTGLALQAKQSDFVLIPMLGILFFYRYKQLKTDKKKLFLKIRIKALFLMLGISVVTFLVIWPQAIFHIKEIYAINQKLWTVQFSPKIWQITLSPPEIFFGRLMLTPVFYYVVYFLITIPILILCLFFMGVKEILKKRNVYLFSILLWFLLPLSLSFYSWRQHGLRYIIEIYPAMAIISAIGFDAVSQKFTKSRFKKIILFLPIFMYLFVSIWYIKPYYLDYFNELVGGINNVYKYNLFQTGWWGEGLREAGLYIEKKAPSGSKIGLAISPEHTLPRFDNLKYSDWSVSSKYDYVIVNNYHAIRDGFSTKIIERDYEPVYSVKADKAILVTIYKLK